MLRKLNNMVRKWDSVVYTFLVLITLAVYWQVHQFEFINFDDIVYVTQNHYVQSGLTSDGIRWAFSTLYAEFWHPLTWISLMLDYQIYGSNAGGFHVTNLIFHVLSTLLLFWLMNRMTGAVWKSAFVAAFFALHPLHVESVAWVAERKDVLSAFWGMLTLCFYVRYSEKPDLKRYLLVLIFFLCALMSKAMAVTLPVIMILLDYWPLNRFNARKGNVILWQIKEKTPFLILSAVFTIITIYARYNLPVKEFPITSRIANALVASMNYLVKTFWPYDLAVFYPFSDQLPLWQVFGSFLLIMVISMAVIIAAKRMPYLLVGWLWYLITLLPVAGIIQSTTHSMHDNYTYLPSIGIAMMLAWGVPLLWPGKNYHKKIALFIGISAIAIWTILTWHQCGYWQNSFKLWNHALNATKNNYLAYNNLGIVLFNEGKIYEALHHYNNALQITKDNAVIYTNRGILFEKIGQYSKAIEDYNEAIRLVPYYIKALNGRGNTYYKLGQYQKAIDDYTKIIKINSLYYQAYHNRGVSYYQLGQYLLAIQDYEETLRLKPDHAEAYYNRGNAYYKLAQYQDAIADYTQAIVLKINYARAYHNRGLAYLSAGNKTLGCKSLKEACLMGVCHGLEGKKIFCR